MKRLLFAIVLALVAASARADHYGSRAVGSVVRFTIATTASSGVATLFTGSPALAVYKDSSTTETTTGLSFTTNFDSHAGATNIVIDTSADGTFYSAGSCFTVMVTSGTVNGVSFVDYPFGSFCLVTDSIASVTGAVGSVTGAVGSVSGAVGSVTGNVGGNVVGSVASVSGNVGGNVTGSVGSVAADGITASSIAADAIGASEVAANAIGASEVADGAIDSGAIATDAVDADALAANAVTEIAAGISVPTVGQIADQVWDEALSGHLTAGSTGAALSAAGGAGDPWASTCAAFGDGTIGAFLCALDQSEIEPVSPVLNGGILELVAGDAYDADHARSLDDFALTGQPTLVGATVTFVIDGVLSVTATSVSGAGGATQTPIFELTAAQTALLTKTGTATATSGPYRYQIQATWAADTPTQPAVMARGFVTVIKRASGS